MELSTQQGHMDHLSRQEGTPFYGKSTDEVAKLYRSLTGGDTTYQAMEATGLDWLAMRTGNAIKTGLDNIVSFGETSGGKNIGINQAVGGTFGGLVDVFSDNQQMIDNSIAAGEGVLPMGLAMASSTVNPVLGAGLTYGLGFSNALEEGRSFSEARGSGVIAALAPKMARIGGNLGVKAIGSKVGGALFHVGEKGSRSLWSQLSRGTYELGKRSLGTRAAAAAAHEVGSTLGGFVGDVADTALFNPNMTVGELFDPENLVPMLLADGLTYGVGDHVIRRGIGGAITPPYIDPATMKKLDNESDVAFDLRKSLQMDKNHRINPYKNQESYDKSFTKLFADQLSEQHKDTGNKKFAKLMSAENAWRKIMGIDAHQELKSIQDFIRTREEGGFALALVDKPDAVDATSPFAAQVIRNGGTPLDAAWGAIAKKQAGAIEVQVETKQDGGAGVEVAGPVEAVTKAAIAGEAETKTELWENVDELNAEKERLRQEEYHESFIDDLAVRNLMDRAWSIAAENFDPKNSKALNSNLARIEGAKNSTSINSLYKVIKTAEDGTVWYLETELDQKHHGRMYKYATLKKLDPSGLDTPIAGWFSQDSAPDYLEPRLKAGVTLTEQDVLAVERAKTEARLTSTHLFDRKTHLFGEGVPEHYRKLITDLVTGLGLEGKLGLVIGTANDTGQAFRDAGLTDQDIKKLGGRTNGFNLRSVRDGTVSSYVALGDVNTKNTLSDAKLDHTVLHEVGHAIENAINQLHPKEHAILVQAYKDRMANIKTDQKNFLEFWDTFRKYNPDRDGDWENVAVEAHSQRYRDYLANFKEWTAEEFYAWTLNSKKPASAVQTYMSKLSEVWQNVAKKLFPHTAKSDPTYKKFMDARATEFYTRILKSQEPVIFDSIVDTFSLTKSEAELVAGTLHGRTNHENLIRLNDRLNNWHMKGKKGALSTVLRSLRRDFDKAELPVFKRPSKAFEEMTKSELNDHFFKIQMRKGLDNGEGKAAIKALKEIDKVKQQKMDNSVDRQGVLRNTQLIVARWLVGDLPNQKAPAGGGATLLRKALKGMELYDDKGIETVIVDKNGKVAKEGKPQVFENLEKAYKVTELMASEAVLGKYQFEILPTKEQDGFTIQGTKNLTFADENAASGRRVNNLIIHGKSDDDLLVKTAQELGYSKEAANQIKEYSKSVPAKAELPRAGMDTVIRSSMTGRKLTPEIVDMLKAAELELKNENGLELLKAVGRDLGKDNLTLDSMISHLGHLALKGDPQKAADIISLLPNQTQAAARGAIEYWRDIADVITVRGQADTLYLTEGSKPLSFKSSIEARNALSLATNITSEEFALTNIANNLTPGALGEQHKAGKLFKATGKLFNSLNDIYYNTIGDAVHMGAQDPRASMASLYLYRETSNQTRYLKDATNFLHATDAANGDYSIKGDRSFVQVRSNAKMNRLYDDIRRLQQKEMIGASKLPKNKDFVELTKDATNAELATVMDLVKRSEQAQTAHIRNRIDNMNQMDQLTTAKKLVGETGMNPDKALEVVKSLDQLEGDARIEALKEHIDQTVAIEVVQLRDALMDATMKAKKALDKTTHFVTERRLDRFLVRYAIPKDVRKKEKTKSTTGAVSYKTLEEAQAGRAELLKRGYTLTDKRITDTWLKSGKNRSQGPEKDVMDTYHEAFDRKVQVVEALMEGDPEVKAYLQQSLKSVELEVATELGSTNIDKSLRRRFRHGRETLDMLDQQQEYFQRSSIGMSRGLTDAVYSLMDTDPRLKTEDGKQLSTLLHQSRENLRSPDTVNGRRLTKFNYLMFLGTNLSSAIIEGATFPMHLTPMLIENGAGLREALQIQKKVGMSTAGALTKQVGKWAVGKGKANASLDLVDPDHKRVIQQAERENKLGLRRYSDIDDGIIKSEIDYTKLAMGDPLTDGKSKAEKAFEFSTKIYQMSNRWNAEVSLLSAFELVKNRNPKASFDDQYKQALMIADFSNANLGKAGRPTMLFSGKGALKTAAMGGYSLMSFVNSFIANILRQTKKGFGSSYSVGESKAARKALGTNLAITLGAVGGMGLPMVGAISAVIRESFGVDVEDEMREFILGDDPDETSGSRQFIADLATNGLGYASGFPADVQSRLSVGGIMGFNAYDGFNAQQMFGPFASYLTNVMTATQMYKEGEGADKALSELLPHGVRRAFRLYSDEGVIKNKHGVTLVGDPTLAEKVVTGLGFGTTRGRKAYDDISRSYAIKERQTAARTQTVNEATNLYESGDLRGARAVLASAVQENSAFEPSRLVASVADKVNARKFGEVVNDGTNPEEARLNRLYGRENTPNLLERYQNQELVKRQFGLGQPIDHRKLLRLGQAQEAMQQDRYLTKGTALSMLDPRAEQNKLRRRQSGLSGLLGE